MNLLKRIGVSLAALLVLAYLAYHTVVVPYTSVRTETALSCSAKETISVTKSYIIRSEHLVASETKGVHSYAVFNGNKVANGGTIASVYASEAAARDQQKMESLELQIANLETLQGMNSNIAVSLDQLDKQLKKQYIATLQGAGNGDLSQLASDSQNYLTLLNRRLAVTDATADFSALLTSLKAERDALIAAVGDPIATVTAPCSGYFVSSVDGYETSLTPEMIGDLTPEAFDEIAPDSSVSDADFVGKVVSDVQWYLAAKVPFDDALLVNKGDELYIDIPASTVEELPVTVASVNKSETGDEAVILLRCNYMSAELSTLRSPVFQIVLKRFDGLRVRTEAIKVEEGQKGVYIVIGSTIRFVPVEILYNGNGYKVCKRTDPLENGLHLYDDIVVKGKNLYDGKPVQG